MQGLSGGGICYGYDLVPGKTGTRRKPDKCRRIECRTTYLSRMYGGIEPPFDSQKTKPGGHYRSLGQGLARHHNPRTLRPRPRDLEQRTLVGRLVWNRLTYRKDPTTGRRRSRHNAPEKWIAQDVPALRIVDDDADVTRCLLLTDRKYGMAPGALSK